jgi:hypothetical protein
MVSGRSEINDGVITKFKINKDLTSDFIVDKLGLYANDTNDVKLRLGLPYTTPPSCDVPMTFELLSIAPCLPTLNNSRW